MADKWTAAMVMELLKGPFPAPAFVLLPQVRNGTGYVRKKNRTADAIAVSAYPSRGLYLVGIEIKVSLSDWRRELAEPEKASEIQKWCRHWYVAAPKDLIPHGEIPANWGLIECTSRSAKAIVKAPPLNPEPPDMPLVASILRAAASVYDCYIPQGSVDAAVESRVQSIIDTEMAMRDRELKYIRERVEKFEMASGVRIDHYDSGNVGEAVKMVLAGQHLKLKSSLEYLQREATRIAEGCGKAIAKHETDGGKEGVVNEHI